MKVSQGYLGTEAIGVFKRFFFSGLSRLSPHENFVRLLSHSLCLENAPS